MKNREFRKEGEREEEREREREKDRKREGDEDGFVQGTLTEGEDSVQLTSLYQLV